MNVPVALAIVVGAAILAALSLVVVRRNRTGLLLAEPTRATPMITVAGTAFAVLLAFVTFAAFQTYNGAKSGARAEAVALLECSGPQHASLPSREMGCAPISSATAEQS